MSGVAIVLFSDLVDSTALLASLGDDRMEEVRRAHLGDLTAAVDAAGGRLVKTLGDGAMASFDSALGALQAAAAIQAGVERLDAERDRIGIAARVGIAAGEPIADGEDLHGMAVVIASRLSSAAPSGEVLVEDVVRALVASRDGVPLGDPADYELKGVPAPVRASLLGWRELAAAGPVDAAASSPTSAAPTPGSPKVRLPPLLAAFSNEPLIGRDAEIAELSAAAAPEGGRRAVLVEGEPGIGKTRHAAAVAAEAHAAGSLVVMARCPPEPTIAFEPWVRAIGELALAGEEDWRKGLANAAGPELAALVPELGGLGDSGQVPEAGSIATAEGGRYRVLRGIGATLAWAAGQAPLLVVLDDAHWCDPASAEALAHLLDGSSGRLVVLVTARGRYLGRRHPVSRALADLRRTGDLRELRLSGLDPTGLAALVSSRVGRAITPGLAAQLAARTAGNPFFAGELARDLHQRGELREGDSATSAPVPDAVADLVDERLRRVDPGTERLLGAVAAIGPSAPVALAARGAGMAPAEAQRAVEQALSERLVDEVAAAAPTIGFPHALIREALIAGTDPASRARLHLALAEALAAEEEAEPAELARHHGLAVELTGPEPAIAAYRAAAASAAERHDHEGACSHLRAALALVPGDDLSGRARLFLDLGEQELLSPDLVRAREAFAAAADAARTTGDAGTLARAALGFAGGDIGFGWELEAGDTPMVALLREGLEALGDEDPRLELRMIFRLVFALVFSGETELAQALSRRAAELERRLGDAESRVLAGFTEVMVRSIRSSDPVRVLEHTAAVPELTAIAADCGREDLYFRMLAWSVVMHYSWRQIPECEAALDRAAAVAERLGSPRFSCEVDLFRGIRMVDRGQRRAGEALIRRGGAVMRRLRPDIQLVAELSVRTLSAWLYDAEPRGVRLTVEAVHGFAPYTFISAAAALVAMLDGDEEIAAARMSECLADGMTALRRPDIHLPPAVCLLAFVATELGDREAGARLRPMFEAWRPFIPCAIPNVCFGNVTEWHVGRLELLAGRPDAAVEELRAAVRAADECELAWLIASARADLALALHRRGEPGDGDEALAFLDAAQSRAEELGTRAALESIERVRAEMDGCESVGPERPAERIRPIRSLATRGGRRALVAMVGGLDEAEIERRFADPRRQRALLKATARGFQPAQAAGFSGVIAYELEPYAIEPPADSPWRWAIEVDSRSGDARLLDSAPLDADVTIHIGLADWVRTTAGLEDALTAMMSGRCSVEGDGMVAVRLEGMFGGD